MKTYTFSEEKRRFFEAMPIPMAFYQEINGKYTAILISDGLCEMMKTERPELLEKLNHGLLDHVHPDDTARLKRIILDFSKALCRYDVFYRSKYDPGGDYHYIHSIGKRYPTEDGTEIAVFLYSDLTESEQENRLLTGHFKMLRNDRFYTDPVTGLPNLNFLMEFSDDLLDKVRRDGEMPALVYFDVIGLRFYNNQYGISRGDELLCLIAELIGKEFPESFVGRGADDHFILLSDITSDESFTEKIISINERVKSDAYGNSAGVQAAICVLDENMQLTAAMDHAKHALKQIGDDLNITHIFYTHETDEKYWENRYILETIDQALKENWIKIYYQAIMRIKTGKAFALEALARWVDPLRGIIMPGSFIPMLNKYHMLYKLDLYMVEQVCQEIPIRKAAGLPIIPVSVNISAQDFEHTDIIGSLNEILKQHNVDKSSLIIEITEQDIAAATDVFRSQIQDLRDDGFRIWIDDFGSGYSALNIFSKFNADLTKFDIDFLRHLDDNNGANRHILKAMVDVSKKLGIHTLVEGMETEKDLEFLKEIGCDFAQGYYYYRPESLGSIMFKIQKGNPILPCETPEERLRFRLEWEKEHIYSLKRHAGE